MYVKGAVGTYSKNLMIGPDWERAGWGKCE